MDKQQKIGVLITNLGTPEAANPQAVRLYLKEFLSDVRVINLPKWFWQIILRLVILPTRPKKTAKAYGKVWTAEGSPLLAITKKQAQLVHNYIAQRGRDDIVVMCAMRYGTPSLASAIDKLLKAGADVLVVLPMYPQYSATTTASTFDEIARIFSRKRVLPNYRFIRDYYGQSAYIVALAQQIKSFWQVHNKGDKLVMSFHGLPQAHIKAGDIYQAQCQATAEALAEALNLERTHWEISFQSRLGHARWIEPYTDQTLVALAKTGTKYVQVVCPGFSADCLETLEEIALEDKAIFLEAGGQKYDYIPCLNTNDDHIAFLAEMILENIGNLK